MMQTEEFATQLTNSRGRQIKFTPERLQQIRNLVERGKSREEIAEFNRRDRWVPASHLFKVRDQSAA